MGARNKYLNTMRYILSFLILIVCTTGCYYDHADLVYPQTTCNVSAVTYSTTVTGILSPGCYSCHSGSAASGAGIKLDTYTSLMVYVSNGQLMSSIKHTGTVPAMPLNASQLSSCDINTIQTWINNGTPNN